MILELQLKNVAEASNLVDSQPITDLGAVENRSNIETFVETVPSDDGRKSDEMKNHSANGMLILYIYKSES